MKKQKTMCDLLSRNMTHKMQGAYLQLLLGNEQHEYQKMLRNKLCSQNIFQIQADTWHESDVLTQILQSIDEDFGNTMSHKIGADFAANLTIDVQPHDLRGAIEILLALFSKYHIQTQDTQNQFRYFQEDAQEALLELYLPYPAEFMRGCILALAKKYQPKFAIKIQVSLLNESECGQAEGMPCLYKITWIEV